MLITPNEGLPVALPFIDVYSPPYILFSVLDKSCITAAGRDKEPSVTANLVFSLHTHSYIDNQHEGHSQGRNQLTIRLSELVETDQFFLVPSLYLNRFASYARWVSGIAHH